ncbi:MAG TPA: 3-dehydroquinate synthase [Candidatus Polarisedimenticolaceae bacterium]|nr:3-dehydroquinate synthase [Candidatus Polarisedimenticolaceae bacterium]
MDELVLSLRSAPRRTCRIHVGVRVLDRLVEDLAADPPGRPLVVISDETVARLHGRTFVARLTGRVAAELLTFPPGEAHKTRETKAALEDALLAREVGRDAAIVAFGGGVTGDVAGFVAATWQRGVPVVQVPTSLVAMVDAALGGKTAVNLLAGKNLVGAFHQPHAIWADVGLLDTLPDGELRQGLAEVVKSACIGDPRLFRWLERAVDALLGRDRAALCRVVGDCLRIKARTVARDERERGRRAVLNFGHTVGHAIEVATGYAIGHGDAVAIGMCVEAELATEATGFARADARRLTRLLERFGLPTRPPADLPPEALARATRRDKKARAGRVYYALPRSIGRMIAGPRVTVEVGHEALVAALGRIGSN